MTPMHKIAEKFGGTEPIAKGLRRASSTVRNWFVRDNAKRKHLQQILDLAAERGIDVKPEDFFTKPQPTRKKGKADE